MGQSTYIHHWWFTSRGWDSLWILLTHIQWIRAVHWLFWATSSGWESQLIILTNSKVWDGFLPWTACLFSTDQWHYFFVCHTDSKVWDGFPPPNSLSVFYSHCLALLQTGMRKVYILAPQPPPCQWQIVHVHEYIGHAVQVCVCVCVCGCVCAHNTYILIQI